MIYTLLNKSGITSSSWGGDIVPTFNRSGKGNVHTTVKGSATVTIQGRMSDSSTWVALDSATVTNGTDIAYIDVFPQMRAIVTGVAIGASDLASGGASTTPATGSITISDNPSGSWSAVKPILIAILPSDALPADMILDFYHQTTGATEGKEWDIDDGSGNRVTFEYDDGMEADSCTIDFSAGVSAGDTITIYDIGGRIREYVFSTTAGDYTLELTNKTEVLVGNGVDDAGTNLEKAMRIDWVANKIRVYSTYSNLLNKLTLAQAEFKSAGVDSAKNIDVSQGCGAIATDWSGGTLVTPALVDSSNTAIYSSCNFINLDHVATGTAENIALDKIRMRVAVGMFIGVMNEKAKGVFLQDADVTMTQASASNEIEPEDFTSSDTYDVEIRIITKNAGVQHLSPSVSGATYYDGWGLDHVDHFGDFGPFLQLHASTNMTNISIGFPTQAANSANYGVFNGTEPVLIEIHDTQRGDGLNHPYTYIPRVDGDHPNKLLTLIATAVANMDYSSGKLTATLDYDNSSVTLTSFNSSLTDFGNGTIQILQDPLGLVTVSGMSGGATGVTVECQLDVH